VASLKRKTRDFELTLKEVSDEGEFSGYGSVYDVIDFYGEVVAPGAFANSLRTWADKGRLPPALWQHMSTEPVGPFTLMREDKKGLYVEGQLLVNDVQRAREARALMKAKAVSGMSIGFDVVVEEFNKETKLITLKEIDLWEVSIVTFPANEAAQIENVKAVMAEIRDSGKLPTLKSFEGFLREAGFSKSHATVIASRGLGPLLREVESGDVEPIDVTSILDEVGQAMRSKPITIEDLLT
jgi:HK97 family phage prohead protease